MLENAITEVIEKNPNELDIDIIFQKDRALSQHVLYRQMYIILIGNVHRQNYLYCLQKTHRKLLFGQPWGNHIIEQNLSGELYLNMLEKKITQVIEENPNDFDVDIIFQQDRDVSWSYFTTFSSQMNLHYIEW